MAQGIAGRWYVEMLEDQVAKSNNGIVRTKLMTFGVNVDDLSTARARLERVEADICGNFKKLGVKCRSLSGLERLELLHGQLHPGGNDPFSFSWDMIPKTGLSTKDFIAPDSFDFRFSRLFRVGTTWGAASYLQILCDPLGLRRGTFIFREHYHPVCRPLPAEYRAVCHYDHTPGGQKERGKTGIRNFGP